MKKNKQTVQQMFTVQVITMPQVKPLIENKPEIHEKTVVRRENSAERQPDVIPPAKKNSMIKTKKREIPSFSSENFREKLISKIDKTENQPEREIQKRESVEIAKIENSLVEVSTPRMDISIPEWYILLVRDKIRENRRASGILGNRKTIVSFRVNRTGIIENISLEVSSGNVGFDRSVLDAVKSTRNLPLFPHEIRQLYLDIIIEFSTEG